MTKSMTTNLPEALASEIARVSAKAQRWRDMMREMPELAAGMRPGLMVMEGCIAEAISAAGSNDIVRMAHALKGLQEYDDE